MKNKLNETFENIIFKQGHDDYSFKIEKNGDYIGFLQIDNNKIINIKYI